MQAHVPKLLLKHAGRALRIRPHFANLHSREEPPRLFRAPARVARLPGNRSAVGLPERAKKILRRPAIELQGWRKLHQEYGKLFAQPGNTAEYRGQLAIGRPEALRLRELAKKLH